MRTDVPYVPLGDGLWATVDPELRCRSGQQVRPMFELIRPCLSEVEGWYRFEAADLDDPEVTVR